MSSNDRVYIHTQTIDNSTFAAHARQNNAYFIDDASQDRVVVVVAADVSGRFAQQGCKASAAALIVRRLLDDENSAGLHPTSRRRVDDIDTQSIIMGLGRCSMRACVSYIKTFKIAE